MDIIDRFGKDHAEVLKAMDKLKGALQGFKVGTPSDQDKKIAGDFSTMITKGIRKHFHDEEELLFKPLAKVIGAEGGPVSVMFDEHDILYKTFDYYQKAVQEQNYSDISSAGNKIIELLTPHIDKEDQVLFPMARKNLKPEQLREPAKV